MSKTKRPAAPPYSEPRGNRILARLPPEEYGRLLPRLKIVPLALKQVLYEARSPIDYAYFLNRGVASALTVMEDGRAIEVATIGDEGMVGLPLLIGAKTTVNRLIVQVPGAAMRMAKNVLREDWEGSESCRKPNRLLRRRGTGSWPGCPRRSTRALSPACKPSRWH